MDEYMAVFVLSSINVVWVIPEKIVEEKQMSQQQQQKI